MISLSSHLNLSDLSNVVEARASLGLGDVATKNTGNSIGTIAAGNHQHEGVYEPIDSDIMRLPQLTESLYNLRLKHRLDPDPHEQYVLETSLVKQTTIPELRANKPVLLNGFGYFDSSVVTLTHGDLNNINPNEHIDHSFINVQAGVGLIGGGTLTNTVILTVEFEGTGENNTVARSDHSHVNYVQMEQLASLEDHLIHHMGDTYSHKDSYYHKNIFANVSSGKDDANRPVQLNEEGLLDQSMFNIEMPETNQTLDHGLIEVKGGIGISGGGNITSDVILSLDIRSLPKCTELTLKDEIIVRTKDGISRTTINELLELIPTAHLERPDHDRLGSLWYSDYKSKMFIREKTGWNQVKNEHTHSLSKIEEIVTNPPSKHDVLIFNGTQWVTRNLLEIMKSIVDQSKS